MVGRCLSIEVISANGKRDGFCASISTVFVGFNPSGGDCGFWVLRN